MAEPSPTYNCIIALSLAVAGIVSSLAPSGEVFLSANAAQASCMLRGADGVRCCFDTLDINIVVSWGEFAVVTETKLCLTPADAALLSADAAPAFHVPCSAEERDFLIGIVGARNSVD